MCSRCQKPSYRLCSRQCQKKDWKRHKTADCVALAASRVSSSTDPAPAPASRDVAVGANGTVGDDPSLSAKAHAVGTTKSYQGRNNGTRGHPLSAPRNNTPRDAIICQYFQRFWSQGSLGADYEHLESFSRVTEEILAVWDQQTRTIREGMGFTHFVDGDPNNTSNSNVTTVHPCRVFRSLPSNNSLVSDVFVPLSDAHEAFVRRHWQMFDELYQNYELQGIPTTSSL